MPFIPRTLIQRRANIKNVNQTMCQCLSLAGMARNRVKKPSTVWILFIVLLSPGSTCVCQSDPDKWDPGSRYIIIRININSLFR